MKRFLDLFTYEHYCSNETDVGAAHSFINCTLLQDLGTLKSGEKVNCISPVVNFQFHCWKDCEDESVHHDVIECTKGGYGPGFTAELMKVKVEDRSFFNKLWNIF